MKTLAETQNLKRPPLVSQRPVDEHRLAAAGEPVAFAKHQQLDSPAEANNNDQRSNRFHSRPNGNTIEHPNHHHSHQQSNKSAPTAPAKQPKHEPTGEPRHQHHEASQRLANKVQADEKPKVRELPISAHADQPKAHAEAPPAAPGQQQQQQPRAELGLAKRLSLDCLLLLIKGLIGLYDLISQPVFYFKHQVRRRRQQVEQVRSRQLEPADPNSPWRQTDIEQRQLDIEARIDSFETYDALMQSAFRLNAPAPCYGYRQLLDESWSKRPETGKLVRQVRLSDYKWCTYGQFEAQIEAARRGLLLEGVRPGERVMLFADTRPEWQICSQALIRLGAVVATMYSTLGLDGILHTVDETEASVVITQRDKVARLLSLRAKLPRLRKIIYFEGSLHLPHELGGHYCDQAELALRQRHADQDRLDFGRLLAADQAEAGAGARVELRCLSELLESGLRLAGDQLERLEREQAAGAARRGRDSLAVIMYTSGSTGVPKGVLISHRNIMATIKSFSYVTKDFVHQPRENTCTAYLPLAHIFEFCIESVMLYHGVRFGFASPHTLTDRSPGLAAGQPGDLSLLKPTVMIIVPLILDRVVQGIRQTLRAGPYFKERLVEHLIRYKMRWQRRHYETPLVDRLVCSKIAVALGGRAKWVICGSAPLSHQTQAFVRAALNLKLPQGFGTTETCAATACQLFEDQSTQNVGLPVAGAQIKLEPWLEGNYRPTDRPNPRGEIVVGGDMIAQGYFKLDEQTREAFYTDERGVRWYRTGDIGEFQPNGQLRIIDRKKDLVKLQNGEYISLGRVESTLKSNPYTENLCVYANSNYNYVVALGPASEAGLRQLARQLLDEHERRASPTSQRHSDQPQAARSAEHQALLTGRQLEASLDQLRNILAEGPGPAELADEPRAQQRRASSLSEANEPLARLCANPLIRARVLQHMSQVGRERNLMSLEIPKKLLLLAEEWTEDKNLVTAAMKIRRNFVYQRYQQQLDNLYTEHS